MLSRCMCRLFAREFVAWDGVIVTLDAKRGWKQAKHLR